MSILSQANFKGAYHPPARTYKKKPRFRIKRVAGGWSWVSKNKKILTKPVARKSEARKLAKIKLKAIKKARL